jgi:hypothetical protein
MDASCSFQLQPIQTMFKNALKNFSRKFRRVGGHVRSVGTDDCDGEGGLLAPPNRDDIRQAYRLILGREPESEAVVDEQMKHSSIAEFRVAALKSLEFRGQYRAICAEKPDPYWSISRRTLVFVHLEKTGGTTLRDLIAANFDADRIAPGPNNQIYSFPVAELGYYDFFAGHFDLDSVRYVPRRNISTITLFREPRSRLISWYRFHKSHPPVGPHAANHFVKLAHQLSAEEFFELPELRTSQFAFNRYLSAFGRSFGWFEARRGSLNDDELDSALEDAKNAIRSLTAIGITEQFERSVRCILKALKLPAPAEIKSANVTDDMPKALSGFRTVDRVEITPRLARALDALTMYDQEIYRVAVSEFERRCSEKTLPDNFIDSQSSLAMP